MEYRKNDILTVKIEDIGNDGEGIGKADGYINSLPSPGVLITLICSLWD